MNILALWSGLLLQSYAVMALQIPPPKAKPVIIGTSDYSNILFGKLQRAASLWGTNLDEPMSIICSGDKEQRLNNCLWNKFAMANYGSDGTLNESDLLRPLSSWIPQADLKDSLVFFDAISPKEASSFGFLAFMKKDDVVEPKLNPEILKCSAERGSSHIFVLSADECLEECRSLLQEFAPSVPSTIIALEPGVSMEATKGWICSRPQDMEGEFSTPVTLSKASVETRLESTAIPIEDIAEIMVQVSLRTDREPEVCPRVVQLRPGGQSLIPRMNADYFTLIGGKKAKAQAGTLQTVGSWAAFLEPFGTVNTQLGWRPDRE